MKFELQTNGKSGTKMAFDYTVRKRIDLSMWQVSHNHQYVKAPVIKLMLLCCILKLNVRF